MRHFSIISPLSYFVTFLSLSLILYSPPTLARPTTSEPIPIPHYDAPPDLTALQPRGLPVTRYNNLGAWTMVLTSTLGAFLNVNQPTTSIPKLVDFFAKVAAQAATLSTTNAIERTALDFGEGAIQFAMVVQDGVGSPSTIPWALVADLATELMLRANRGNPTAFKARVMGPMKPNVLGGQPWIEIVLVVAGEKLMDGINWGIF